MHDEVILFEPSLVRLDQNQTCGDQGGPKQIVGSILKFRGANPATGYSLIEASSLEDAHKKAKGCPILKAGGMIEIAQAMDM